MPKDVGYVGGGMNRPKGPTHDNPTSYPTSYKDSPAKTRAGSNRHGFKRNPKQDGMKTTSDPFPTAVDAAGTRGPKGDRGLARNQVVGSGGKAKEYDYGEPNRRNMKDMPSA